MKDGTWILAIDDLLVDRSFEEAAAVALAIRYEFSTTKPAIILYRSSAGFWHVVTGRNFLKRVMDDVQRRRKRPAKGRGLALYLEAIGVRVAD